MRVAYADPPYIGKAKKHYGGVEVNHELLIAHLCDEFPAGWALSCSSPTLQRLLPLCPEDIRIGAWVKSFHVLKPNVSPSYGWEPVIFRGGRKRTLMGCPRPGTLTTPRDWYCGNITWGRGVVGAKPLGFCFWLFDMLGLQVGDIVEDIFPGSGAVGEAWNRYGERLPLEIA